MDSRVSVVESAIVAKTQSEKKIKIKDLSLLLMLLLLCVTLSETFFGNISNKNVFFVFCVSFSFSFSFSTLGFNCSFFCALRERGFCFVLLYAEEGLGVSWGKIFCFGLVRLSIFNWVLKEAW